MTNITNDSAILAQLANFKFIEVDRPVVSYDTLKKQVVYSFIGRNNLSQEHIIELRIKRTDIYSLERVCVFTPNGAVVPINITTPLTITAIAGTPFSLTVAGVTESPETSEEVLIPTYTSILPRQPRTSFLLNSYNTPYLYSNNSYTGLILSL
jgi:hypothetical protein